MSFTNSVRALSRSNDLSGVEQSVLKGSMILVTATLDFPPLLNNETAGLDVSVPGASLGDIVILGLPPLGTGLTATAFVTLPNIVDVRLHNAAAGTIDQASLVFNVLVIKP